MADGQTRLELLLETVDETSPVLRVAAGTADVLGDQFERLSKLIGTLEEGGKRLGLDERFEKVSEVVEGAVGRLEGLSRQVSEVISAADRPVRDTTQSIQQLDATVEAVAAKPIVRTDELLQAVQLSDALAASFERLGLVDVADQVAGATDRVVALGEAGVGAVRDVAGSVDSAIAGGVTAAQESVEKTTAQLTELGTYGVDSAKAVADEFNANVTAGVDAASDAVSRFDDRVAQSIDAVRDIGIEAAHAAGRVGELAVKLVAADQIRRAMLRGGAGLAARGVLGAAGATGAAAAVPLVGLGLAGLGAHASDEERQEGLRRSIRGANRSDVTADQLQGQREGLQDVLPQLDTGAITEAQSVLVGFRDLAVSQFDEVMTAGANLSQVLGTDLAEGSAIMAAALTDPINGLGELEALGIQFTERQKEMMQQMLATGQAAEAQAMILERVGEVTGDAAADAVGVWDRLGQVGGQALELIMGPLRGVGSLLSSIGVPDALTGGLELISNAFRLVDVAIFDRIEHGFQLVGEGLEYVKSLAPGWLDPIMHPLDTLNAGLSWTADAIEDFFRPERAVEEGAAVLEAERKAVEAAREALEKEARDQEKAFDRIERMLKSTAPDVADPQQQDELRVLDDIADKRETLMRVLEDQEASEDQLARAEARLAELESEKVQRLGEVADKYEEIARKAREAQEAEVAGAVERGQGFVKDTRLDLGDDVAAERAGIVESIDAQINQLRDQLTDDITVAQRQRVMDTIDAVYSAGRERLAAFDRDAGDAVGSRLDALSRDVLQRRADAGDDAAANRLADLDSVNERLELERQIDEVLKSQYATEEQKREAQAIKDRLPEIEAAEKAQELEERRLSVVMQIEDAEARRLQRLAQMGDEAAASDLKRLNIIQDMREEQERLQKIAAEDSGASPQERQRAQRLLDELPSQLGQLLDGVNEATAQARNPAAITSEFLTGVAEMTQAQADPARETARHTEQMAQHGADLNAMFKDFLTYVRSGSRGGNRGGSGVGAFSPTMGG